MNWLFRRGRRASVTAVLVATVTMAVGCAPTTPSPPAATAEPAAAPTSTPTTAPATSTPTTAGPTSDAFILVTARVTAQNGAALDVAITLDTLPRADAALLADMTAQCSLDEGFWPADAGSALLWSQTISAVPVGGTPTWPVEQELWLLSLAAHGLAAGDGAVQERSIPAGLYAICGKPDTTSTLIGPGTTRLTLLTSPSGALTGFSADEILAVGQYGFATGFDAKSASTITDCRVTIAPEVEAARARVGLPWRVFAEYEPWADFDSCGVGVPNEEIP